MAPSTSTQPRLLLMGPAAVSATSKLMLSARPVRVTSSFGVVDLVPGSVWQQNRLLIDCSEMVVHYMVGAELYQASTQSFVRDAWLNGIIHGASQAQWLVHLAQVEKEFLMGLFVPIAGILALSGAQMMVVYAGHRAAFRVVHEELPAILTDLKIVRSENPTLTSKVLHKLAGELVMHIPEGIGAEDLAFWVGRILKGVGALPDFKLTALSRVLVVVTTLVTLAHSPGMAARGAIHKAITGDIQAKLRAVQVEVSEGDAAKIASELGAAKESKLALKRLEGSLKKVLPPLKEIFDAWEKTSG